jgi:vacuolar-type H+-ATPase subunit I/STV1
MVPIGVLVLGFSVALAFSIQRYDESQDVISAAMPVIWYLGCIVVLFISFLGYILIPDRKGGDSRTPVSDWDITITSDGFHRYVDHVNKMLTIGFGTRERLIGWAYSARFDEKSKSEMIERYVKMYPIHK